MRYSFFIGLIIISLFLRAVPFAYGQTTSVMSGFVTDAMTGKPMPFVNVYVNGSTQGAVTDEKGAYTLTLIPLGTVEVVASFVGYQSEKRTLRVEGPAVKKADFQLKESVQMLDAVTVKGSPKIWERQLRQFKKQLFGEPYGGQCILLNSEVLNFKKDKDHLYATVSEPLIIDNQALGYKLFYDLQHFDATASGKVYSAGTARFEALKPENEKQASRFNRNRLSAYHGSVRHLMATLADNTFAQAGFLVYQEDASRPVSIETRSITLAAAVSDYKRLVPVKDSRLIQPGKLPSERRLVSAMKLVIFYTHENSVFSPYPDARYAYTEMLLPAGQMQMTMDGIITMPQGMEAKGSMGDDRLSTMLPAEWKPAGVEKEAPASLPLAVQGRLAPADSGLSRLAMAFNSRFQLMSPALFLHIDKPLYLTGDRMWMSAYLLDAVTGRKAAGEKAMQVDILTPEGKLVQHQWIRTSDGRGEGNFRLSDTLASGIYRLRAYTGQDEAHRRPAFERSVQIYNLLANNQAVQSDSGALDVQVLPEGGRWVWGLPARLGIKIVKPDGNGLSVAGSIVDDQNIEIATFKTNQQGITSAVVTPEAKKSYFANVTYNGRLVRTALPVPDHEGLLLSADAVSDTARLALTIRSANGSVSDSAYILIQQRGRVIDQRKVILQNGVAKINLPVTGWLPGLAQITIYDAGARPQAERLVFIQEFIEPVRVSLSLNKTRYQPRETVTVSVNLKDNGLPVSAALSASITDVSKMPDDTSEASLQTHLLLTGELRGHIQNPNQYFTSRSPASGKALDDLLLTQGWRRVSGTPETDLSEGISLMGRIMNAKDQPTPGAQLTLASIDPKQPFVKLAVADQLGRVRIEGLSVSDTIQLMTKIADRHAQNMSAQQAYMIRDMPGQQWQFSKLTASQEKSALPSQLDAARIRQEQNSDFYRDKSVKILSEVTVRAKKTEERPADIQGRSLHNVADAVVKFDEKSPAYSNLYEMLQGRVAGVTVSRTTNMPGGPPQPTGYKVSVRGLKSFKSGTQPLILMDGVPVQDPDGTALMNFSPRDIERIEVLKNAGTAGVYGVQGGNGVIAFYSKGARSMQGMAGPKQTMTPFQFIGYPSVQREFYVPRYDDPDVANMVSGTVDSRDVLYWKPLMQTNNQGHSQLRFPLSDVVRTLRVVIQGITSEGRPVFGVQLVQVQ